MRITYRSKQLFFVASSAAFYAASFLWTSVCWPFSFFCFIPLFFCSFHSYKQAGLFGFLWGLIAYGFTLSALLDALINLGDGWQKYLCAGFFLFYFVFSVVIWFCCAQAFSKIFHSWLYGWIFSSAMYFQCMASIFFYPITGVFQGYGIACPLVPLEQVPRLLMLLPFCGWQIMRMFLLFFQAGIAFKKKGAILLGLLPFLYGFIFYHSPQKIDLENKVVLISGLFKEQYPYERMFEIAYLLDQAAHKNPQAELFVLPESAFPFVLQKYPQAVTLWSEKIQGKSLIIGSHYQDVMHASCYQGVAYGFRHPVVYGFRHPVVYGFRHPEEHGSRHPEERSDVRISFDNKKNLYNSAFFIKQSRITGRYDKKHLLPFFEKPCFKNVFFQNAHTYFMKNKDFFSEGSSKQEQFIVLGQSIHLLICSELLWNMPEKSTVYALVHDGHYRYSYYPNLFLLFVQFQAHLKQSKLFYCSWKKTFKVDIL